MKPINYGEIFEKAEARRAALEAIIPKLQAIYDLWDTLYAAARPINSVNADFEQLDSEAAALLAQSVGVSVSTLGNGLHYLANVMQMLDRPSKDLLEALKPDFDGVYRLQGGVFPVEQAAPEAVPQGWKAVPVNPTPEMWKAAKSVPDPNPPYPPHYGLVWDAMLAASPTPPVEQAAPKTAPGVGDSGFDHKTAADLLNNKTVSDEAVRKFVAASRWAHDERAALSATLLAMHGVLTSREAEIALLKKALMEAEAAPRQEAQEPCGWTTGITWRPDTRLQSEQVIKITRDTQPKYGYTTPIYTAPQPAPAPLSEMPYEKRKAIQEGEQISASDAWFHARINMLDTLDRRNVFRAGFDRGWNAALAAQGGKDA